MKNKKPFLFLVIILSFNVNIFSQNYEHSIVPLSTVFHNFGNNLLHSISFNYGINFLTACLGTYGIVESGLDWKYYQAVYGNSGLANYGMSVNVAGYITPVFFPLLSYSVGRIVKNEKLQILGVALAQTSILSFGIQTIMKGITGRRQAGVYDLDSQTTDYSKDFNFGFFRRGIIDGWPSAHTMNAVASAVTISEIYKDKLWVKIAAYSYAGIASIGMTFCDHWLSDVVAGWLLGYAIGKTIGRSFYSLIHDTQEQKIFLDVSLNYIGVRIRV